MNTAIHYGLGAACATTATEIGTGMKIGSAVLMKIPTLPTEIAGAVLAVGGLIQDFFFQPDCDKIATTQIVNQAEQLLQQNLAAWQSLSATDKTLTTQAAALQNFDNVWAQVVRACESGAYGSAGQACVNDRAQGSCHYQVAGGCWNWFVGYRDPIANDPQVQSPVTSVLSSVLPAGVSGIDPNLLIGAGFLVVALVLSQL